MSIFSSSPSGSPREVLSENPERSDELRERVSTFTETELETLLSDAERQDAEASSILHDASLRQVVERRMEELHVTDAVRAKWQSLRSNIDAKVQAAEAAAEQSFLEELKEKGGVWGALGTAAITILSWLGFKKAAALKASLKEKGYLKTAIESAKEHPIFAAFIAALGIKAGFDVFEYMQDNAKPITDAIAKKAEEMGVPGTEAAKDVADKLREMVGDGFDKGLSASVKGLATVLGGTYDEETGVVDLGGSTLHAPVVTAFLAGTRRRTGQAMMKSSFSRLLIEDRMAAILRQSETAGMQAVGAAPHKRALAERGLDLLTRPMLDAAGEKELASIIEALEPEMNLEGKAVKQLQASPEEIGRHLSDIEERMRTQNTADIESFNNFKINMQKELLDAEKAIRTGEHPGTVEEYRKTVIETANNNIHNFRERMTEHKVQLGKVYERALNGFQDSINDHVRYDLDPSSHGRGTMGGMLETSTKGVEAAGYGMRKLPGGKYVLGGVIGYSFLPLVMQGAAALRPGEEGEAAKKALIVDATDIGMGFVPVVGELNDLRAAFTGKDLNGRELDTVSRVTSGIFGTLGAAALAVAPITGGASYGIFKILRGIGGARRAVRTAKLAENGITAASATAKSIDAVKKADKSAAALEKMYTITKTQKYARSALNTVRNAQRTMQLVTYGHLGVSLASGVTELYNSAEGAVGTLQAKAMEGIDAAESFATDTLASL